MKNLVISSLAAFLSVFMLVSCGDNGEDPGDLYPLTVQASKAIITPDSIDQVTLTVKYKGEVVTEGVELFVNDTKIEPINYTFKTATAGTYKFRAKVGSDNSQPVAVVAKNNGFVELGTFRKKALTFYITTTWCLNCPSAMNIIKAAEKDYPGRIVTLTWHSTMKDVIHDPFGLEQTQALMTWLGGVGGFPMVNIDNTLALYPGSYDKRDYEKALYKDPMAGQVGMAIETKLEGRVLTGTVSVKNSSAALADKVLKLNVVATESGLVSTQMMPDGTPNSKYVHDHVVREVFTPLTDNGVKFGEVIPKDKLALGSTYTFTFEYVIPQASEYVPGEYNAANMSISAFVTLGDQMKSAPFIAAQIVPFGQTIDFEYNKK